MTWLSRVGRAWRRHGWLGFSRLAIFNLGLLLSGRDSRHRYVNDTSFDRAYGVDTSGSVAIDEVTAPISAKSGAVDYEPTPPAAFSFFLAQACLTDCSGLTFIDLGSGKGRTLLLAGLAGFAKVIGVELGEELHATAKRNIDLMTASGKISGVESICGDARSYRFAAEPTVCFLNNPFSADVLGLVLQHIERSLRRDPRSFTIIYYHANHSDLLDGGASWHLVAKGNWEDASHHFAIYRWETN